MSKAQQSSTYSAAQGQMQQNQSNEASANTQIQGVLSGAENTASSVLPGVTSGYSDLAGSGGGLDTTAENAYSTLAAGTPQATTLANTGGLSPSGIQAMKDEASQAAQSTYATGQAAAARTAAATGGYGNTSAVQENLARTGGQAAATATQNELASITGMQQQGEEAGTSLLQSGMTSGAGGLAAGQQNVTSNKLAALGGATNIYGMSESQVTSTVSQILQNYQQTGQLNASDMGVLQNLANQPGVFDKIISTIGTLGGAAGGVMSGIGTNRIASALG
jgi:hypothetical protein